MPRVFYKSHYFTFHAHVLNHLEYLDKQGSLFTGTKEIGLQQAQAQVNQFPQARKWWFVFSLNREDQERLQIDRTYMQQLVDTQKAIWAKAYNIPIERLHIYASFHDTAHHPHIHVVLHGETPTDGYILCKPGQRLGDAFKNCRETVKSALGNEVFREDTLQLKVEKSEHRKELNQQLDQLLLQIGRNSHPVPTKLQNGLRQLTDALTDLPGKHQYGYLPPDLKDTVDELLKEMIQSDPQLHQIYQAYYDSQKGLVKDQYVDSPITLAKKMATWEKEFYHPLKGMDTRRHNLVVQAAEQLAGAAAVDIEQYKKAAESEGQSSDALREEAEVASIELYKKEDRSQEDMVSLYESNDIHVQAAAQAANAADVELYKKEKDIQAAESTQTTPSLTGEQAKALEKVENEAVRTMERELSGRFWDDLATAMRSVKEKSELQKGGWENQKDAAKEAILDIENIIREKIPELNSAVLAISEIRACTPDEALESMELLHYRVLQYIRHMSDENYISLNSLQAEKDSNRYFQMFSSAVRREIVATLDQNPELQVIATDIQSQAPTISEDGKEVPVSYKTLPSDLQKRVNKLIESCWRSPEIQEAAQILYNKFSKDEDQKKFFKYLLQGGRNASIAQRAAVKALLSFSLYEPELSAAPEVSADNQASAAPETPADNQVPAAPETPAGNQVPAAPEMSADNQASAAPETSAGNQVPAAPETPADNQVPAAPETPADNQASAAPETPAGNQVPAALETPAGNQVPAAPETPAGNQVPAAPETPAGNQVPAAPETPADDQAPEAQEKQEKLKAAIRNVRYAIEKDLLHSPQLQHFLGSRLLQISSMANPETGVQSYQKMSAAQRNAVNTCLRELLELPQFKLITNKAFSSFCTVEDIIAQPTALHQLIVDYAAAATKDHPIDLALKEKRSAGYKVLCTWDKLLCDTLNAAGNTADGEEIQALIQKLFDKARTPREKAEYAPPDYYRQLSPPDQDRLSAWLQSVYDKHPQMKRTLQERSVLDQCSDPLLWFKKHLAETTEFQNLAVQHLKEKYLDPDKKVMPKFEPPDYHPKSQAAAMRGLLHLIGLSMRNDTNRNQVQSRQSVGQKHRLKAKKIHRQTIEERGQKRDALEP